MPINVLKIKVWKKEVIPFSYINVFLKIEKTCIFLLVCYGSKSHYSFCKYVNTSKLIFPNHIQSMTLELFCPLIFACESWKNNYYSYPWRFPSTWGNRPTNWKSLKYQDQFGRDYFTTKCRNCNVFLCLFL